MNLIATNKYLAELVSDLSEALTTFSKEALKLNALLARSETPSLVEATMSYGSNALSKSRLLRNT